MSELAEQVIAIVGEKLGVDKEKVNLETSFIGDLGADSLDMVELLMNLEDNFKMTIPDEDAENIKFASLNKLLGLYKEGYFPGFDTSKLKLDQWQIITPYRPGGYGTLGINKHIQSNYREPNRPKWKDNSVFYNADKVIRLYNWYTGYEDARKLKLSNGSIGL